VFVGVTVGVKVLVGVLVGVKVLVGVLVGVWVFVGVGVGVAITESVENEQRFESTLLITKLFP
jgi:hypothetical protein